MTLNDIVEKYDFCKFHRDIVLRPEKLGIHNHDIIIMSSHVRPSLRIGDDRGTDAEWGDEEACQDEVTGRTPGTQHTQQSNILYNNTLLYYTLHIVQPN